MININSCIYEIKNKLDGKRYIGSAINFKKRFYLHKHHLSKNKHSSVKLQRAWNKYGESNFEFNIIIYCDPKNLIMYEQRCIDGFDTCRNGYNISPTAGSTFGFRFSEESKKKMSEKGKQKTFSELTIANMSKASKLRWQDPVFKEKMSKAHIGLKHSDFSKKKMSEAQKGNTKFLGHKHSEEWKNMMRVMMLGRKHSIQSIKKISESHKKRLVA